MQQSAFAAPSALRLSLFRPKWTTQSDSCRRFYTIKRSLPAVCLADLRQENELPEKMENPMPAGDNDRKSDPSEDSLLDKLNRHTNNRKDIEVSYTTVENAGVEIEKPLASGNRFETVVEEAPNELPVTYGMAARALWRIGWTTWWVQLILTVIAGVILLFSFAFPSVNVRNSASAFGFIVAAIGVFFAFVSLFWTYSYTRLSLSLQQCNQTLTQVKLRISGRLRFGLVVALVGLLVSLTGLQAIVGTLLARLLSSGIVTTPYSAYPAGAGAGVAAVAPGANVVQPIDVLIIQACANAMTALMVALASTIWLRSRQNKWIKESAASSIGAD